MRKTRTESMTQPRLPKEIRDSYCTPRWLANAIGPVWFDACTNARSHIRADKDFRLERGQDALVGARYISRNPPGLVFCNPPYSAGNVLRFVRALRHTRFCFLVRLDTSTVWFSELWPRVELIAVPRQRVNFEAPPDVATNDSSPFPHALLYARAADATTAIRRLCYCTQPVRTAKETT